MLKVYIQVPIKSTKSLVWPNLMHDFEILSQFVFILVMLL